ncbi:MAG: hypothetical protein LBQ31_00705 [Bacteroidales bacterium]|nr:hypothetical protein [Bacteroidales bacterium]
MGDTPSTDFGLRTSDFGLRTSDFGLRTSDFGLRTSDFFGVYAKMSMCSVSSVYKRILSEYQPPTNVGVIL